ncbi:hypothetical protein TrVE_jg12109 [Triparma verrucosa]|uniref:Uncharacterized protein n=1 Tax=Triparma verrucosa TaxID=1606542 RepID=A0A9W7C8C2_9STRA|nr:hypothetical protein TrVE_jg12109 [Triparma verrucosa]
MGPMLFFSFEVVSCFISQGSFDNGQCTNTSASALYLSSYLAIFTNLSIVSKAVPRSVQKSTAFELSALCTLELELWQKVQGICVSVSALASLYLLSALGVEGDENPLVWIAGGFGLVSIGVAWLINLAITARCANDYDGHQEEKEEEQRRVGRVSAGDLQEGMFVGAFV